MPYTVTGSPVEAFADAVLAVLRADAALVTLVGGVSVAATKIVAALPAHARTNRPYVVVSQNGEDPGTVAMQKEGGQVWTVIDVYSDLNGPHEARAIQSRIRALFPRNLALAVTGYNVYVGSLVFEQELVMSDFDPDMPERSGYHGVQRLVADVEEAA